MTETTDTTNTTPDTIPAPGRPVRLVPVPPGFWMVTLGVCLAALAPLFGFLIGVMNGRPRDELILGGPIYWGLFTGVVIGGLGVLLAVAGGVRLWRHNKAKRAES